eukprot:3783302-Rhodomonas_salina.2
MRMFSLSFTQPVPLDSELHLSSSTVATPELAACLTRQCRGCQRCQTALWNNQHCSFRDLLAQLDELRAAAAEVELQLQSTADACYDACTHFWFVNTDLATARCIRCQHQGTVSKDSTTIHC